MNMPLVSNVDKLISWDYFTIPAMSAIEDDRHSRRINAGQDFGVADCLLFATANARKHKDQL